MISLDPLPRLSQWPCCTGGLGSARATEGEDTMAARPALPLQMAEGRLGIDSNVGQGVGTCSGILNRRV